LEIDLSYKLRGIRRRDPNARFRVVGREGPILTGVRPAAPADLPPPASRLHGLAVRAGQSAAADHLTHLFGRTTCPDCASEFSVAEQIAAFQAAAAGAGAPRQLAERPPRAFGDGQVQLGVNPPRERPSP
jgi:hypothetical protein